LWKTRHVWCVVVRVNDDDFVSHEDHFDVDVEVLEQGDVGLKVVWDKSAGARRSKFEKDPLASRDVVNNSPSELGFVHAPRCRSALVVVPIVGHLMLEGKETQRRRKAAGSRKYGLWH
jgi:hypothetical protein